MLEYLFNWVGNPEYLNILRIVNKYVDNPEVCNPEGSLMAAWINVLL